MKTVWSAEEIMAAFDVNTFYADENPALADYLAECTRLRAAFERNPGASVDELYRAMFELAQRHLEKKDE